MSILMLKYETMHFIFHSLWSLGPRSTFLHIFQGGSSFSVITRMFITANQTQGRCPEVTHKPQLTLYTLNMLSYVLQHMHSFYSFLVCQTDEKFNCTNDDDCMAKLSSNLGNGELIVSSEFSHLVAGITIRSTNTHYTSMHNYIVVIEAC